MGPFIRQPESVATDTNVVLAQEVQTQLSASLPTEVLRWKELIVGAAREYGLDPNLFAALIQKESWFPIGTWPQGFDRCPNGPVTPSCTSTSGALGMAQVMPFHFAYNEDGRDPQTNLFRGAEILARYIEVKGGDLRLGLAAYNCGPNREPTSGCLAYADQILEWYAQALATP
ncbi:MAG: transglycosylase SLT domain-containing protein [candidate division WWE3 bacterium]|nr:transglycosylase SLT domain-containing protein [candidate division WWE3 bacterium]